MSSSDPHGPDEHLHRDHRVFRFRFASMDWLIIPDDRDSHAEALIIALRSTASRAFPRRPRHG
ncbi:Hypothetical protein A7982_01976 [Minicystis rosea]|nr:Hypothetical protein A7982_01976 [Minicystis rosea]